MFEWINATDIPVDVYPSIEVYEARHVAMGPAELQFTPLFREPTEAAAWPPRRPSLTELATAVGLVYEPVAGRTARPRRPIEVPGLDRCGLAAGPAAGDRGRARPSASCCCGRSTTAAPSAPRCSAGVDPSQVEWLGAAESTWTSDIPRDITVDGVWFIQAKYDSTCVLNTSPSSLVDELLVDHSIDAHHSWYEEVALDQLQRYYQRVRQARRRARARGCPDDVRDLDQDAKDRLKTAMRVAARAPPPRTRPTPSCAGPSPSRRRCAGDTASRPRPRPSSPRCCSACCASPAVRTGCWAQRARAGAAGRSPTPTRGGRPTSCAASGCSTPTPASPRSTGGPRSSSAPAGTRHHVEGFCELRWSHGKLQGFPECKVQVTTPLDAVPGYALMTPAWTRRVRGRPFRAVTPARP